MDPGIRGSVVAIYLKIPEIPETNSQTVRQSNRVRWSDKPGRSLTTRLGDGRVFRGVVFNSQVMERYYAFG